MPNLGLGYVAASLESVGHRVEIWDELKENGNLDRFEARLYKREGIFDLVGFYFITSHYSSVVQYSRLVKNINNKIITVVGGPHPTVDPLGTLENIQNIDFAIAGEGEKALLELIEAIEGKGKFKDICNLVWRQNGKVIINKRNFLDSLDKIPIPAWHLLRPNTYPLAPVTVFSKNKRVVPIVLTRGCPFGCKFCAATIISGRKIRHRNLENVIEEICLLKSQYNMQEFHIMDSCIGADRDYILSFCNLLIKQNIKICWACTIGIRVDNIDKDLIQIMERAGCYSISVGIESGVQRVLDLMKKNIKLEKIEEKIELIHSISSIRITGFFILGYPGESLLDMRKTIDFACKLKIHRVGFFNFTPVPGTVVYNELNLKLNNLIFDKLSLYSIPLTFGDFSAKKLKVFLMMANIKFYFRPKIIFGILKEIQSFDQVLTIIKRLKQLINAT